ncbi:MAG: hypothetical protein GF393_13000 [Armatimonadia bacterium]|nr:hypothetical protein [Armatimonadia bacterium]
MPTAGISAPAEVRVVIDDTWLEANSGSEGVYCDILTLTPAAAFVRTNVPKTGTSGRFEPRGVSIGSDANNGADATYSSIRGCLKSDPNPITESFTLHVTHPNRFRRIYPWGTTARRIIIKG